MRGEVYNFQHITQTNFEELQYQAAFSLISHNALHVLPIAYISQQNDS